MAVFGELVLIGIGLFTIVWSVLAAVVGSAFSGKSEWIGLIPVFIVGVFIVWVSIHYGVITVGISK